MLHLRQGHENPAFVPLLRSDCLRRPLRFRFWLLPQVQKPAQARGEHAGTRKKVLSAGACKLKNQVLEYIITLGWRNGNALAWNEPFRKGLEQKTEMRNPKACAYAVSRSASPLTGFRVRNEPFIQRLKRKHASLRSFASTKISVPALSFSFEIRPSNQRI